MKFDEKIPNILDINQDSMKKYEILWGNVQ